MTTPSTTAHEDTLQQPTVGGKRLWIGVLTAPSAWVLMEFVGYYLAARSCEPELSGVPFLGTANPRVTQVVLDVVALVAGLVGLSVACGSWRTLRSAPARRSSPELGRAQFLAFVGVLTSALFLGGLVLFGLPPFLVNACSQAR
jgi:hypothetical protein